MLRGFPWAVGAMWTSRSPTAPVTHCPCAMRTPAPALLTAAGACWKPGTGAPSDPEGRMLLPSDSRSAAGEPPWPRVPVVTAGVRLGFRKPSVSGGARATAAMADVKQRRLRKGSREAPIPRGQSGGWKGASQSWVFTRHGGVCWWPRWV